MADEDFRFEPLYTEVRTALPDTGPIELTDIPAWQPPADDPLPSVDAMLEEIVGDAPEHTGRHAVHPPDPPAQPPSPAPRR